MVKGTRSPIRTAERVPLKNYNVLYICTNHDGDINWTKTFDAGLLKTQAYIHLHFFLHFGEFLFEEVIQSTFFEKKMTHYGMALSGRP